MMSSTVDIGEEAMLQWQAQTLQFLDNFVESMALRCVVELGVADALNSHPMTLSQIAACIPFPTLHGSSFTCNEISFLQEVFDATIDKESGDIMYGLANSYKWLLTKWESEVSLVSYLLLGTHPCVLASWNCLTRSVAEGGAFGFSRAHGSTLYDFLSKNYEFEKIFGEAMASNSKLAMNAVLMYYKDGFNNVGSIVDVGGGSGAAMAEIVKAHPHIKGFNFDLPSVVASASEYPHVTHVGGDMFATVPHADAIFLKWILHNWGDAECLEILKNCKKALPEKNGKVIIVDAILYPQGENVFDVAALRLDLQMLVMTSSGK